MSLTLDDFQQLATEIQHLVRAGMPLEQSLVAASGGRGKKLAEVAEQISEDLKAGKSLPDILSQKQIGTPRMLSAAIAAGIRSDNLAVTVEMMGDFASDIVTLRQRMLSAATYPLTIVTTAGLLMTFFVSFGLMRIYDSILDLGVDVNPWMMTLLHWNSRYPYWLLIFPAIAMMTIFYWVLTGRASALTFRGPERLLLWLPGVGALVRDLQQYTMTRMLGLLIQHQIPLDEALVLAGGASGNPKLQKASEVVADQIRRGESVAEKGRTQSELPSLMEASLRQVDRDESRLAIRMRSVAEFYRGRLDRNAAWIHMLMPIVTFVVIGGGCVTMYAATVFWPAAELYRNLGQQ